MPVNDVTILGPLLPAQEELLSPAALSFLAHLHRMFEPTRQSMLAAREERQRWEHEEGYASASPPETSAIRDASWQVSLPTNMTLAKRRTLVSLEDRLSPLWDNILLKHSSLRTSFQKASEAAPILVPRGWHLPESHFQVDSEDMSATLFDFGLAFFHAATCRDAGNGFLLSLPKLEHYLEARLWNDVFVTAQSIFGLPLGSIRAIPEIGTVASLLMAEEILFELREHIAGVAVNRENYVFSLVRAQAEDATAVAPTLAEINDNIPFISSYLSTVLHIAHKRGVSLVGVSDAAIAQAGEAPGTTTLPPESRVSARDLLESTDILIRYLSAWLCGKGVLQVGNHECTTATAELCRSQLWQWRHVKVPLTDGGMVTAARLNVAIRETLATIHAEIGGQAFRDGKYAEAATVASDLVMARHLPACFTLPVYRHFMAGKEKQT